MIIAIATGNGLRKEIRNKVIGFGGDIQIMNYQPNPTYEQVPAQLSDSAIVELKQNHNLDHVQPFARKAGIVKNGEVFEGAVLKGIGPDFKLAQLQPYITDGRIPRIVDSTYNDSIVLSKPLAKKLALEIGDRCSMFFVRKAPKPPLIRKFYVGGLYQTDFEQIDNSLLIGDVKHVQRLNKWTKSEYSGFELFLKSGLDAEEIAPLIRLSLPFELEAYTAKQLNEQLFQWLKLFDFNILLVLIIMIAVATINMSIALLILILERTSMIGVLKALGSHNPSIRRIFLINASHLILRGLFWGNLIGISLCFLQQKYGLIKLDPATYYVNVVAIDLNIFNLILLNVGTLAICLICLVLPSYLITRISPVKAIRFD